jgi:cell division protein FtsQ
MPDSPPDDEPKESADRVADATPPLGTRIDPRLRARRIAVKRQAGRRRLRWSFVAGAVALLLAALFGLSYTPLVSVARVDVDGVVEIDPTLLESVVDGAKGSSIVWLDLAAMRARLEADPWVRKVRVSRDWPRTVRIEIVERRPVASFAGPDGQVRVVDSDGRVLAVLSGLPVDYPFLAVNAPNLDAGSDAPPAVLAGIAVAKVLPDELRNRIKLIDVSDAGQVQIELTPSGTVIIGAPSELRDKLASPHRVAQRGTGPPPTTIDGRFRRNHPRPRGRVEPKGHGQLDITLDLDLRSRVGPVGYLVGL